MFAAMKTSLTRAALLALAVAGLAGPALAQTSEPRPAKAAIAPAAAGMVAAADPRAVAAGQEILSRGGSATDAAIATMMVLGLVEPHSAGIGGGGFLMHYDAATRAVAAYDGREKAPAGAKADMFMGLDGKPMNFRDAVISGKSVGTPSLVAMLKLAHDKHGNLPWAQLFQPAIKLAEDGFVVSPRLSQMIGFVAQRGGPASAEGKAYLLGADGKPLPAGTVLKNPQYAAALRAIARQGPRALSRGPIAAQIVKSAQAGADGGTLSLADLRAYKPRTVTPICGPYRAYTVCGFPPPSSGGSTVLQILGLFERARPQPVGPQSADDWAAFLWASRLGYVDRDYYLADDTFAPVPLAGLIAKPYLDSRAPLIDLTKSPPAQIAPGDPSKFVGGDSLIGRWGSDTALPTTGTTHLTVVDGQGRAVVLTATVESIFGSQRMASGFFLNNQLTDFSLNPMLGGKPVANAVAAGKRPRSSMAPTIVLGPDGKMSFVVGSPGGSAIIAYVAKAVIGVVDWKLPMADAIALPNLVTRGAVVRAEIEKVDPDVAKQLAARGWTLQPTTLESSGLHGVRVLPNGNLEGGADPRREGTAAPATPPAPRR
jgi:gamma-glutamyltranspeptidase / glutathione hydrolase